MPKTFVEWDHDEEAQVSQFSTSPKGLTPRSIRTPKPSTRRHKNLQRGAHPLDNPSVLLQNQRTQIRQDFGRERVIWYDDIRRDWRVFVPFLMCVWLFFCHSPRCTTTTRISGPAFLTLSTPFQGWKDGGLWPVLSLGHFSQLVFPQLLKPR